MPDSTSTLATFRIDAETWHKFKAAAAANDTSASAVLKKFVTSYAIESTKAPSQIDSIQAELQEVRRRLGELSNV